MQLPIQLEGLRSSGLCGHGQLAEVRAELWDPLATPSAPTASFLEGREVLRGWGSVQAQHQGWRPTSASPSTNDK